MPSLFFNCYCSYFLFVAPMTPSAHSAQWNKSVFIFHKQPLSTTIWRLVTLKKMITQSAKGTDGGGNSNILGKDLKFLFFLFYISWKTISLPRDYSKNHRAICAIAAFLKRKKSVLMRMWLLYYYWMSVSEAFFANSTTWGTDLGQWSNVSFAGKSVFIKSKKGCRFVHQLSSGIG